MRAKMSCPRSSVPNGWCQVGGFSRAEKSISLTATFQTSGPNTTSATITASTNMLTSASLWRRKRRHASRMSETLRGLPGFTGLAITDAGVEPAIKQVGNQVEDDDQAREHEGDPHDHRRVVA